MRAAYFVLLGATIGVLFTARETGLAVVGLVFAVVALGFAASQARRQRHNQRRWR